MGGVEGVFAALLAIVLAGPLSTAWAQQADEFIPDAAMSEGVRGRAAETGTVKAAKAAEIARLRKAYPRAAARMEDRLLEIMDRRERVGRPQAAALARERGIEVVNDEVTVIILRKPGADHKEVAAELGRINVKVVRDSPSHIKAKVPLGVLRRLAEETPGVERVRLPRKPLLYNSTISEGVAATQAGLWHAAGYTGAGVKIGVIDGGFIGLAARKAADEIPASAIERDETGTGMETDTEHGCGVAETVYDMAPAAELHLIHIESAKDYCIANGIQVVNHSMGWYAANFFDGVAYASVSPHPVAIANDAIANGVLWVNAAGNDQQRHALLSWHDADADNWMDWTAAGAEINQIGSLAVGAVVVAHLTWNAWPTTDQDFDLYLLRWTGSAWTIVAWSENWQTGTQPPTEAIGVAVGTAGFYGLAVAKYSASTSPTFILRSWHQNLQFKGYDQTAAVAGSIGCPADAAGVVAAGAINQANYTTGPLESFSSLGPNNGAYTGNPTVTKPDLCGPDGTTNATYSGGFYGTSASSPHVAGAAALVRHAYPTYGPADIKLFLEGRTVDMGSAGKDSSFGAGRMDLSPAPDFTDVWVDFAYTGLEEGTESRPFNTLAEGVSYAAIGGTVHVKSGASPEILDVDKQIDIVAEGGEVTVGSP
jgi:hypothetical protein